MPAKFQIKTARDGQIYFTLMSAEGKKLLSSETYKAKAGALNGIESVRQNAGSREHYDPITSETTGKFYFTLKASNHEVIGVSELYDTVEQRAAAVLALLREAQTAETEELDPPTAPRKSDKAEVLKSLEARRLNKRTMRPISPMPAIIPFGAIVTQLKEEDRRLHFNYLGEAYEADLNRTRGALRMIE